ncbi:MAG: hypothetical protein F4038_06020 [Chloroflexi bacterium]|nr:hypothetical protein [Chloroflexota bacterium]MYJ92589.1 hypothetical protein [Chloroflexota bacterium]
MTASVRKTIHHPDLRLERRVLQSYNERRLESLPPQFAETLKAKKLVAVSTGNQSLAKAIWCLESIGRSQDLFTEAFTDLSAGKFKSAWDKLEQCEIVLVHLKPHFTEVNDRFGIRHMRSHIPKFQDLYPFTLGVSPAYLFREMRCSVCDARIYLRNTCDHVVGEIYDGEMCARAITDVDILEISLVDNPNQKYSVIFPNGDNDSRLSHLQRVAEILESPWTAWSYEKEERKRKFGSDDGITPTQPCPCGSSKSFQDCDCPKELTFPHFEIEVGDEARFDAWARKADPEQR